MAGQHLNADEFISPGTSIRMSLLDAQDKSQSWLGVVHSRDDGRVAVRLNAYSSSRPGKGVLLGAAVQRGGYTMEFEAKVEGFDSGKVPKLILSEPTNARWRSLRRYTRVSVGIPAAYRWYCTSSEEPYPQNEGLLLDISKGGAGLAVPEVPESETLVHVMVDLPDGGASVNAECVRRHTLDRDAGDMKKLVGLEFILISAPQRKAIEGFVEHAVGSDANKDSPPG